MTVGRTEKTVSGEVLSGLEGVDSACGVFFQLTTVEQTMLSSICRPKIIGKLYLPRLLQVLSLRLVLDKVMPLRQPKRRKMSNSCKFNRQKQCFVQYLAEHNLPFRTGDHFTKLVKSMFPDSGIFNAHTPKPRCLCTLETENCHN